MLPCRPGVRPAARRLRGALALAPLPYAWRDGYVVDHRHVAPSHTSRVRHLVMHYTDSDEARSLAVLTGPHASAHYVLPLLPRDHRSALGSVPVGRQVADDSQCFATWQPEGQPSSGRHHRRRPTNPGPFYADLR
jgi:hypothetical protein